MSKINTMDAQFVDAPAELVSVLETAGFDVGLLVRRRDGRALAGDDHRKLIAVLTAYEAGRGLDVSEEEAMAAVTRHEQKATGTGGE